MAGIQPVDRRSSNASTLSKYSYPTDDDDKDSSSLSSSTSSELQSEEEEEAIGGDVSDCESESKDLVPEKLVKFESLAMEGRLGLDEDVDLEAEFPREVPEFLLEKNRPKFLRGMVRGSTVYKQMSWSNDGEREREEAWARRSEGSSRGRRSRSVTDEDLDELRGCIDLGFKFDVDACGEEDRALSDTLPALDFYYAVNRHYNDCVSRSSASDCSGSPIGSPHSLIGPADNPKAVKNKLRQWAQVVACSVRQRY